MYRAVNEVDHLRGDRDDISSRMARRAEMLRYQEEIKAQISEQQNRKQKQNRNEYNYVSQIPSQKDAFSYSTNQHEYENPMQFQQTNSTAYVAPMGDYQHNYSPKTHSTFLREPTITYSPPLRSQLTDALQAKIAEQRRAVSNFGLVPPLSHLPINTFSPTFTQNTHFNEASFEVPSPHRNWRSQPPSPSYRNHITPITITDASGMRNKFPESPKSPTIYRNGIVASRIPTPSKGFSKRVKKSIDQMQGIDLLKEINTTTSPAYHEESLKSGIFTFADPSDSFPLLIMQ